MRVVGWGDGVGVMGLGDGVGERFRETGKQGYALGWKKTRHSDGYQRGYGSIRSF